MKNTSIHGSQGSRGSPQSLTIQWMKLNDFLLHDHILGPQGFQWLTGVSAKLGSVASIATPDQHQWYFSFLYIQQCADWSASHTHSLLQFSDLQREKQRRQNVHSCLNALDNPNGSLCPAPTFTSQLKLVQTALFHNSGDPPLYSHFLQAHPQLSLTNSIIGLPKKSTTGKHTIYCLCFDLLVRV